MSYGELVRTTFRITWRNRYLWFFGLFAGSASGGPSFGGNFDADDGSDRATAAWGPAQAGPGSLDDPALIAVLVLAGVLIVVLLVVLSLVSQGALAEGVAALDRGEERDFRSAWRAGRESFWRVLRLVLVLVAMTIGILLVVGAPLAGLVYGVFAATDALGPRIAVGALAALIGIAALILLLVVLQIVAQLGLRELVLRGGRAVAALREGYRLFRGQLATTLVVFLIFVGIALGAGIILILTALVVGLLLFLPTILLAVAEEVPAAIVTGVIAGLIWLPLFLTGYGALGTFNHAYWTLAYLRLRALPA